MRRKVGYTNVFREKKEGDKYVQKGFLYLRDQWVTNVLWYAIGVFTSFLLRAMIAAGL